jgi:predicted nucleic acid-binding protein
MRLVIDANIIFAALIKDGGSARLIFHEEIQLFSPEFVFEEMEKYSELILLKTHRTSSELDLIISLIKKRIDLVPMDMLKVLCHLSRWQYPTS